VNPSERVILPLLVPGGSCTTILYTNVPTILFLPNTLATLISVLSFLSYKRAERKSRREQDGVFTELFYPMIVLDGDLYEACIEKGSVASVKEQDYLQLRTDHKGEIFMVDIITKRHFDKFFPLIEQDHEEFVNAINQLHFPAAHKAQIKRKIKREHAEFAGFPIELIAK
jgi:hypothetical protein